VLACGLEAPEFVLFVCLFVCLLAVELLVGEHRSCLRMIACGLVRYVLRRLCSEQKDTS
jgi:hypothetical protein